MKKLIALITILSVIFTLAGCQKEEAKYKVGATPVPHAEILRQVQPILAAQGFFAASVEHRLSPEAKYPAAISDLKTFVKWIKIVFNWRNLISVR